MGQIAYRPTVDGYGRLDKIAGFMGFLVWVGSSGDYVAVCRSGIGCG